MSETENNPTLETTPSKKPDPAPAPTFTQADMDRVAGDRAVRAKEAAYSELLKELGFEDLDKLKETAKEAKKRKEDELSATEKLQKELDKLKAEHDNALKLVETEKAARLLEKRDNHIKEALTKAKAANPENILILMNAKKPDVVSAVLGEGGEINAKGLDAFIKTAQTDYKNEFAPQGPGSPSNKDGKPMQTSIDEIIGKKSLARW